MPYVVPTRPLVTRRLRGMRGLRGLGQSAAISAANAALTPPLPVPPGLPAGWDTGYPTVATPPVAIFTDSSGALPASTTSTPSFLPAQTLLTYVATVTFTFAIGIVPTRNLATIVSDVGQALQSKWHIALTAQKLPAFSVAAPGLSGQIVLTVQLNTPYGKPADVQSIIDGEINALYGVEVSSSSIAVSGSASPGNVGVLAAAAAAIAPQTPSWFSQNWPWVVGGGAVGLFLLKDLL